MRVISALSQRFEPQSEPIFPPPPDLSLPPSLSLCSLTLSFSSLHIKSSCECQRSCGSAVAAAFLSLSLLHSSCSHRLPASTALTHHLLLALSLFLPPLLAIFHSLASLFSTPLPILGKSLWETNFSVCRSHKERDYGLICWLRALSASRQVAAPYSILIHSFFFFSLSPSSTIQRL